MPSPPDLELVAAPPNFFRQGSAAVEQSSSLPAWCRFSNLQDGAISLCWPGLFQFLISVDGRRIAARPLGQASWESFQTYLLGQALSFALIKQGLEPLHATVVVTEKGAVALLGDCGSGKSSLAAVFLKAGYSLLTDDLLILKEENGSFLAYPSFPRIKLFPEIARTILGRRTDGALMNPHTRKLIIPLGPDQFCPTPHPLKAIFQLRPPHPKSPSRRVTIRRLTPRQAHLALHANTFNFQVTESNRLQRLFRLATRVTAAVPAKSLSYPRDLGRLPQVVEAVLQSLERMPPRRG